MKDRIVILVKTPLLGKGLSRIVGGGGLRAEIVLNVEEAIRLIESEGVRTICLDVGSLEKLAPLLGRDKDLQVLLVSGSCTDGFFESLSAYPQINHLFGLRYPDAPPRQWEFLSIIRRLSSGKAPPTSGYLSWGAEVFERRLSATRDIQETVEEVETFAKTLVNQRQAGSLAEVAHELCMNAMYDAPVDANGRAPYAHDRTKEIELPPASRPSFYFGTDGIRLVLSAHDPFGRLQREHLFRGLHRGLTTGTMDQSGGGAGLGFIMIYRACTLMFVDVIPGKKTQVTAILELDVPSRELRGLPRSVHYFQEVKVG